jgi:DNA-binding NarL/FixJ family response regulator
MTVGKDKNTIIGYCSIHSIVDSLCFKAYFCSCTRRGSCENRVESWTRLAQLLVLPPPQTIRSASNVIVMSGNVMSGRQRILIVEDHRLVRQGLRALLDADADLEIVAEAENGCDAIRCVGETSPDLVLMDISMPGMNGMEAISEIKARYPKVKVLVLTVHVNEEYIHSSLRSGANGYVVKDATREKFMEAIHDVLAGHTHLCSQATEKLVARLMSGMKSPENVSPWDSLTHRERQVLQLIAEGQTNKTTAKFLSISPKTVEKHRASLMAKLDVHSTAGLTAFAVQNGIVDRWSAAKSIALFVLAFAIDWSELLEAVAFI